MSNPWFRMYAEFAHDPKVQMMAEDMQRRYMMLMCMRCSNALVTLHETEIAFHMRIEADEIAKTKALFIAKGFIDSDWNLLNWEKRQFISDTSSARVNKHRTLQKEKQANDGNATVTLQKQKSNVLDTDTDTDTEKKERERAKALPRPDDVEDQVWTDWLQLRKAKGAPVTATVLKTARKESALAGMTLTAFLEIWCARGSHGLEASWLRNTDKPSQFTKPAMNATVPSRQERDPELVKREQDEKLRSAPSLETLAAIAKIKQGIPA